MRTDIDVRTPAGFRITGIATRPGPPDTPLLVCLPGGSYNARYFDVPGFSLLDAAEANGFTAIALDRPGYGGSDPLPADERTFARNAEVLDEAIAALWAEYGPGHRGVVLISHSIGSAVAVHIAAGQPAWPLLGITRPGLYNYISSKEQLLAELVRDVSENTAHIVHAARLRSDLSSVEKLRVVVRALALQRAGAPERFRVLDRTEAALPEEVASLHLKARREVLAEVRTIIEEGVSRGEFRPRDERLAALSVIGMCNWVAWWFHPGSDHPAEPMADQLAQNAVDMLAYPDGTGSPASAPHRALRQVRENLDYLERFLGPEAGPDPDSTPPS